MLVSEMTATQLFGLQMLAFLVAFVGLILYREYPKAETSRERLMFWLGAIVLFILPAVYGLQAFRPVTG